VGMIPRRRCVSRVAGNFTIFIEQPGVGLTLETCVGTCLIRISPSSLAILTKVCGGLFQSLQLNAGKTASLDHGIFYIHFIIWLCYDCCVLTELFPYGLG